MRIWRKLVTFVLSRNLYTTIEPDVLLDLQTREQFECVKLKYVTVRMNGVTFDITHVTDWNFYES